MHTVSHHVFVLSYSSTEERPSDYHGVNDRDKDLWTSVSEP